MSKIVYRYDNEDYADGQPIRPRGDSYEMLTPVEKVVEQSIRKTLPDGANVRGTSLYTWEDEAVARRLWQHSGKKYLYAVEVDDDSIRHIGDLDLYTAAKNAVAAGQSPDEAVKAYCKGEVAVGAVSGPRREVLVSEGRVIGKIASR